MTCLKTTYLAAVGALVFAGSALAVSGGSVPLDAGAHVVPVAGSSGDGARRHIAKPKKRRGSGAVRTRREELDVLYEKLAAAPNLEASLPIAAEIEQYWAQSRSPTADLLVVRASKMISKQKFKAAHTMLEMALDLQPDHVDAWGRTAHLYYLEQNFSVALGAIRRALALEPKNYKALEGMGRILIETGDKKNALKAYDSLLKVYPHLPGVKAYRDKLALEVEGRGI